MSKPKYQVGQKIQVMNDATEWENATVITLHAVYYYTIAKEPRGLYDGREIEGVFFQEHYMREVGE